VYESFLVDSPTDLIGMIEGIKAHKSFGIKHFEHNFRVCLRVLLQNHAETLKGLKLGINASPLPIIHRWLDSGHLSR
jgi:hypothetical protein